MIIKEKVYISVSNHYKERGGGDNQLNFPQELDGRGLWLVWRSNPITQRGGWVVKLVPRTEINTTRNKGGKRGGD